jgi:hypothetical protein
MRFLARASDGSIILASYHPRSSSTWIWSLSLTRKQRWLKRIVTRDQNRSGQWHDYLKLPFGWALIVSRQDYHRLGDA